MHGDPLAARDVAADRVAGHRLATLGDLGEDTAFTLDSDFAGRLELRDQRNEGELAVAVRLLAGRHVLQQHGVRTDVTVADSGVEVVEVGEVEFLCQLEHPLVADGGEGTLLHATELLVEQFLALGDVFFASLLLEPDADLLGGARGFDEGQPVATRTVGTFRGQHFDDVAVLQLVIEGDHAAVRLRPNATMANLGVDPVGKVDRSRAGR